MTQSIGLDAFSLEYKREFTVLILETIAN